jgi:hypothetical protein
VAVATSGGFDVHRVGPVRTKWGTLDVNRSEVCYSVSDRQPRNRFNREIPAVPDQICYWTNVNGFDREIRIFHVWRRNGRITDRIPLQVGSTSWRTWSKKRNLASGTWIVTSETRRGEIFDSREFQIG